MGTRRGGCKRQSGNAKRTALLIACGVMLATAPAYAEPQALFMESGALKVTLEGPFRILGREREDEPELPALLRYLEPNGREVVFDVRIKPRGVSRLRHCLFPPLRLNFETSAIAGTIFEGQDKLKLVTHCRRSSSYRDYIAREYQIYRAYNLLTDNSFRVRWLSIDYVDTDSRREPFNEAAFVIEEDWAVAERVGMEAIAIESLKLVELDRAETALMSLFQFMVGNADWSAFRGTPGELCCHNGKALTPVGQTTQRVVLPYDFDQAGFVNAEYAVHNQSLGFRPGQHPYRGYCALNDELDPAIARMGEIKEQWLAMIDGEPVSERARQRGLDYIGSAYEIIADPKRLERNIIRRCRE